MRVPGGTDRLVGDPAARASKSRGKIILIDRRRFRKVRGSDLRQHAPNRDPQVIEVPMVGYDQVGHRQPLRPAGL
jgi:hypothetical protein